VRSLPVQPHRPSGPDGRNDGEPEQQGAQIVSRMLVGGIEQAGAQQADEAGSSPARDARQRVPRTKDDAVMSVCAEAPACANIDVMTPL